MPWFSLRPRDPADPRWPLAEEPALVLKAADASEARAKFAQAYPSAPYGTPAVPVPDAGAGSFRNDPDALLVSEAAEPPAPRD